MDKALIKYISIGVVTLVLFFVNRNNKEKQSLDDYYIENISSDPPTLDPHMCSDNVSCRVIADIFEGLVCYNQQNEMELCGAEKYEVSEDGLKYTFYLRRDAKWSNGDAVTADDYIFALQRATNPKTAAPYSAQMLDIVNAAEILQGNLSTTSLGVKKEGDYTLVIELKNKNHEFIHYLTLPIFYPVHKSTIEKEEASWATKPENIISNGAYKIIEWVHNGHIILNKNPHYWDQNNVKIEKVKFLMINDTTGDYTKFCNKEEHMTASKLPVEKVDWYRKKFGKEFVVYGGLTQERIVFNLKHKKFQNKCVRKALSMTLDRDSIVKNVLKGGHPSYCAVLETISNGAFLNELAKIEEFKWVNKKFNERVQEAKKLLEEAGYNKEHPLEIQLAFNIGGDNKAVAEAIQATWNTVFDGSVICSLLFEEWQTYLANQRAGKYEMSRSGWGADFNLPSNFTQLYTTDSEFNFMGYSNHEVDQLYSKSLQANNNEDYIATQKEINKIITCDYVAIPYTIKEYRRLVSKHVKGVDFSKNALDRFSTKYFELVK